MLLGRDRELAALVDACRAASAGRGSGVVVVGEPGIGKTTLLQAAVRAAAPRWRMLRTTGVEAESTVAFATLQALLWPLRDGVDELEAGQARLLRGVLDLGPLAGATTFAVGAAALTLVSISSEEDPVIAVVDDAHWADVASQEVLSFVGRRLEQERVALLAGTCEGEPSLLADDASFLRVELHGLDPESARSLLERSASTALTPETTEWLLDACAGNPLGLVELPLVLTEDQRRGDEPLPASPEAGPLVQRAFATRASRLGPDAERALLVLAAAGEADAGLVSRLGLQRHVVDTMESSGLVEHRVGTLEFRHPLVQSAIYAAAAPDDRREAHRILAAATDGARRAWHLAGAAEGPDESTAEALEAAAEGAHAAGGLAAEAQALERAAELTPDDERRVGRLLAAAQKWRRAGRIEHARALLDRALSQATMPIRARIQLERGSMLVRQGEIDEPCELLLTEADRAEPTEPKLAAQMLVEAAIALDVKPDTVRAIAIAERARQLAGTDGDRPELEAVNALLTVRTSTRVPPDELDLSLVLRAAELVEKRDLCRGSEEVHWIAYCLALHERDDEARRLSERSLAEARVSGDVWSLCFGLYARAAIEQATGRIDAAHAWASEAVPLAEQIGEPWRIAEAYGVLGETEFARGDVAAVRAALEAKELHLRPVRPDLNDLYRSVALGNALVACGRFEEAVQSFERAARHSEITIARAWYYLLPLELAEALVLAGHRREAEARIRVAAAEIEGCALLRPRARLARVRGLLASEAKIDACFSDALAQLERAPHHLEHARVELCWGERLRRGGRSSDAVAHLEHALARFDALGAVGWAERTRGELETASSTTRPPQPRRTDVLTAQELRAARHAAAGRRDRDIAALLYLSPRTVESYLHSAYRKLEVSNRTQLAGVLAGDGIRPAGSTPDPVPKVP